MTPPVLTDDQRAKARDAALSARRDRAHARQLVSTGHLAIADLLASDVPAHRRMRVRDALEALPSVGPVRSSQIMSRIGIAPTRRIQGLSPRQREELVELVHERFSERPR